jgi:hypothetical protein
VRCGDHDPGLLSQLQLANLRAGGCSVVTASAAGTTEQGNMRNKERAALWHGIATLPSGILQVGSAYAPERRMGA